MKTTANLGLKKPEGTDVVNIDDFNYNADVIDTELQKRALKTDIPTVPVQSVNGKTGTVSLTAADVGAATAAQGIKVDTALQSSQLGQPGGPAKQDDFMSHLADLMTLTLNDDNVKGTIAYPTFTSGQLTKLEHKSGATVIRTDSFTYSTNLITEVRTMNTGGTTTFKYHTDTLQVEVI